MREGGSGRDGKGGGEGGREVCMYVLYYHNTLL